MIDVSKTTQEAARKAYNHAKRKPNGIVSILVANPDHLAVAIKELETIGKYAKIKKYPYSATIEYKNGSSISISSLASARGQHVEYTVIDGSEKLSKEAIDKLCEAGELINNQYSFPKKLEAEWVPSETKKGKPSSAKEPQQS